MLILRSPSKSATKVGKARRIRQPGKRASGTKGPGDSSKHGNVVPKGSARWHVVDGSVSIPSIITGQERSVSASSAVSLWCGSGIGKFHHSLRPAGQMFQGDKIADDHRRRRRICGVWNVYRQNDDICGCVSVLPDRRC